MKLWEIAEYMGAVSHAVISFVGAGGKTSCMLELAQYWAEHGEKVLVTTSAHMEHPDILGLDSILDKDAEEILEEIQNKGWTIAGRAAEHPQKIRGINTAALEYLNGKTDKVLIEADGSKRYAMKVPGKKEPVIEAETTHIFIMAGASALGMKLEKGCFRQEEAEKILERAGENSKNRDSILTVKLLGKLLEEGYVKKLKQEYPEKKIAVILNQTDRLKEAEKVRKELEGVLSVPVFTHEWKKSVHTIVLAAGFSRRFGENKLLYELDKIPLYQHLLSKLEELQSEGKTDSLVVVSQYDEILEETKKQGISVIKNEDSARGISSSLQLGLEKTMEIRQKNKDNYYMFFAADQPWLQKETIQEFLAAFLKSGKTIGCVSKDHVPKNPVIFHEKYMPELMALTGDTGGKKVLKKHMEDVFFFEVKNEKELMDCDYKEDIQNTE